MADKLFHVKRYNARSFAQISYDRSEEHSLAEELYDVRRITRIIAPALQGFPLGINFGQLGNVRRKDGTIYLFVYSAVQRNKLRQLIPRLEELVHAAGYRDNIEIKVLPGKPQIELRENHTFGKPRSSDPKAGQAMMKTAEGMAPSALKDALEALAKTLLK